MKSDIYRKRGEYYLDPSAGDTLPIAFSAAKKALPKLEKPITIIFNGTAVRVEEGMDCKTACQQWDQTRVAERGRYLEAQEQALDQAALDTLAGEGLDNAITAGPAALAEWIKDYTGTLSSKLDAHRATVTGKLAAAGYAACEDFANPPADVEALGKYMVGRLMLNVEKDYTLPRWEMYPLCDKFIELDQQAAATRPIKVMHPLTLKMRL